MMNNPLLPLYVLAAILGLVIGSFLNVVIYRVPREESLIEPGSHCPACGSPIKARHNVPVLSWLLLRGRCAACRMHISARYPLVELATGALFLGVTMHFGLSTVLPAYLYLAAVAVTLTMIDWDGGRLPDSILLPSYVVAVLLLMPAGAVQADPWVAYRALIGMTALMAVYLALTIAHPTGMAFGDVKLAGLVGLYLGYLSWSTILIGAFSGFALIAVGGALRGSVGPARIAWATSPQVSRFGPFILAAALLAVFVSPSITGWYGSLLGMA